MRADGKTIIENAAKEPHIVDVANFLNLMGANIKGAGTDVIKIVGVEEMHGCEYSVIPDQITTGTYMMAAAATEGDILIKNVIPKHMEAITAKLSEMGVIVLERRRWDSGYREASLEGGEREGPCLILVFPPISSSRWPY